MDEISHISFLLSFCFRANGIWCHPLTVPPWTPHTFSASCIVVVSLFQCVLFSIQLAVYGVGVGFIQGGGGQTTSPLPTGGGGGLGPPGTKKKFWCMPWLIFKKKCKKRDFGALFESQKKEIPALRSPQKFMLRRKGVRPPPEGRGVQTISLPPPCFLNNPGWRGGGGAAGCLHKVSGSQQGIRWSFLGIVWARPARVGFFFS